MGNGLKKIWLQMDIFMAAALAAGLPRGGEHWRAGGDGSLALIFFADPEDHRRL